VGRIMKEKLLPESEELLNLLLNVRLSNAEQVTIIEHSLNEIEENPRNYDISEFWEMDKHIGGIGGYCMPFDPRCNPFPSGVTRELFRPLQYAASEIEINKNIKNNARYAVQSSGQHLEAAAKYKIIEITTFLYFASYKKFTLGQSIGFLKKKNALPVNIIKSLSLFVRIYNLSKHGVNQEETRERLFSPADALVAYTSSRMLGKEILKPYYSKILKEISKYINRLNGLNMNL